MIPTEERISAIVHNWCNEQLQDIPDFNRIALMDRINGLVESELENIKYPPPSQIKTLVGKEYTAKLLKEKPEMKVYGGHSANHFWFGNAQYNSKGEKQILCLTINQDCNEQIWMGVEVDGFLHQINYTPLLAILHKIQQVSKLQ